MKERQATTWNGLMMLLLFLAAVGAGIAMVVLGVQAGSPGRIVGGLVSRSQRSRSWRQIRFSSACAAAAKRAGISAGAAGVGEV